MVEWRNSQLAPSHEYTKNYIYRHTESHRTPTKL